MLSFFACRKRKQKRPFSVWNVGLNLKSHFVFEIDVKEFDLPEVTSPQTLESILNEPDDDVFIDELVPLELLQGEEQGDTVSVGSSDLDVNRTPTKRRWVEYTAKDKNGSECFNSCCQLDSNLPLMPF